MSHRTLFRGPRMRARFLPPAGRRTGSRRRALVALLLLTPAAASAQRAPDTLRLSLAEARAMALRANPELVAARMSTDVARGELRQAGVLQFNPTIEALGTSGGGLGPEAALSQEIEVAGQRGLRRKAARAGVDRTAAEVADAARLVAGAVDRTFYRLAAANRRTELAREVVQLNADLSEAATRQLQAGEVSRLDFNLATVELGRSRARLLEAENEREQAEIELRRLLGLPPAGNVEPVIDSTVALPGLAEGRVDSRAAPGVAAGDSTSVAVERLVQRAVERRPDLAARAAAIRQAESQASLARREALPNLVVRAASERGDAGTQVIRPGIGLTLPVFNRNQGAVEARRAEARQAELERAGLVARIRAEVRTALATYNAAADRARLLETSVLPQARQNRQLLEIAYREGKIGLPVLLLTRNQVIDAELEYWDAWLAQREALATLAEATGQNTQGS